MELSATIWKKLPVDIFNRCIYPYTHRYQSKQLLEDIRNYDETWKTCNTYYYNKFIVEWGEREPENNNWLINDIGRFLNNDISFDWGYYPFFFTIWNRSFCFKHIVNKKGVERSSHIMRIYEHTNVHRIIRLYWGLFLKEERLRFLSIYCPSSE